MSTPSTTTVLSAVVDVLQALKLVCMRLPRVQCSHPSHLAFAHWADPPAQVARLSWPRLLRSWLYVPLGFLLILLACWGVDSLIGLSSVSFPASVALLLVLFLALLACQAVLGDKATKRLVRVVDVPVRSCSSGRESVRMEVGRRADRELLEGRWTDLVESTGRLFLAMDQRLLHAVFR